MTFEEEVKYFLNQHQISFSDAPKHIAQTPFELIQIVDNQLIIHTIPLESDIQDRFFFQNLSDIFEEQNIKIIHLWEDVWINKKSICQSRLLAMCGISERIPARLTQVRRIDKPTLDAFLGANHLQVCTNAKFKYGLFLPQKYFRILKNDFGNTAQQEILVAVASFSNAKTILRGEKESRSYELIRFANLKNVTVVGGLNKLLKAFINEHHPDDIMTYADRDWSNGASYEKIGFKCVAKTTPQGFWLDKRLMVRYYENKLTEHEKRAFKAVFNSGNLKFILG